MTMPWPKCSEHPSHVLHTLAREPTEDVDTGRPEAIKYSSIKLHNKGFPCCYVPEPSSDGGDAWRCISALLCIPSMWVEACAGSGERITPIADRREHETLPGKTWWSQASNCLVLASLGCPRCRWWSTSHALQFRGRDHSPGVIGRRAGLEKEGMDANGSQRDQHVAESGFGCRRM
jgi:hypothetical protein